MNITSAVPSGGTASLSGTSQAAPHVAGTIALMKEANQGMMLVNTIRDILRNSAYWNDSPGSPWGAPLPPIDKYGYGRVDTYQAVATTLQQSPLYYVTIDNQIVNQTFKGETIYILAGNTAQVTDELVLDANSSGTPSKLYIHGILNGSSEARIKLLGNSEIIVLPGGVNNFSGIIEEPNILDSPTFSTNTVLSQGTQIVGNTTIDSNVTLTISSSTEVTIEGTVNGSTNSKIAVNGRLVLMDNTSLHDIELTVEDGAVFIAEDNTTVDMSISQLFTINGTARLGDGFRLKKPSAVKIADTGSLEFLGDATLEFTESATMPPLYAYGYMEIRGEVQSSLASNKTVTMRLSPVSSAPAWGGISVYNTASGSLKNLRIEDATTGITLSSASNVSLSNMEIVAPSFAGISSSSSSFLASNIFVTDSGNKGILISGGSPEIDYFEVTGSSNSGIHAASYSNTYIGEGEITGSGGGASSAGVWVNNASYTHVNGYNGPNNGWDVRAENYAWVWFNGTYWDGSPYSSVDGTSTLSIQNPNNPQKNLPSAQITAQAQLHKDWAERYRESPEQAVEWLRGERASLTSKLDAVAAILLADYHLSQGNFAQVKTLLGEVPDHTKAQVEPGAFALRNLQLALNAVKDKALAYQSLQALHQAHMEPQMLAHYTFMVRQRYGDEDSKELTAQTTPEKHPALFNYPNPFNPVTTISYHLPTNSQVSLKVYDLLGREVAALLNERKEAGSYTVRFDASQLSSGLYLYRLQTEEHIITSRMTLIK